MSGCKGLHCPGCGDGSGGAIVAVLVVLAVIGAVLHAIWHTLVEVAEIAAWTALGAAVLGAGGGIGYLVIRARQDRPGRPIAGRVVSQLPPKPRPQLEGSHNPAIGAGRELHLHLNVSPDQLAAILRHYSQEE